MQTQEAGRSVHAADRFGFAGLVLDLGAHSLTDAAGAEVALTPAEFTHKSVIKTTFLLYHAAVSAIAGG